MTGDGGLSRAQGAIERLAAQQGNLAAGDQVAADYSPMIDLNRSITAPLSLMLCKRDRSQAVAGINRLKGCICCVIRTILWPEL